MSKERRRDIFNILILIVVFLIVYLILTRFTYLFGSTKDWNQQHYLLPEYFRNLFYETGDLFPDFAFNLGNGQNIYNFSYYGFLNPIILISYLLPFISMRSYIIGSTIFMLLLSAVLMYFFIKKKTNSKIAFICSFLFLMAEPLIYHSHRHIMFMNYMPFLILGYYGVDKYFKDNSKWLLTLSVFLMIMTSYFFSVSGIVSIVIYGIYCYIKKNNTITVKSFIGDGIRFLIPILIGVLMSGILIVPTFYSLLNGRTGSGGIDLGSLFVPEFSPQYLLYSTYSCGLSSLALLSLFDNLFKKRENRFLSLTLLITLTFPIILYVLNGFLYIDGKVLITFIPLFIILISNSLDNIIKGNVSFKKLLLLTIFGACLGLYNYSSLIKVLIYEFPVMLLSIYLVYKKKSFKYLYFLLLPVVFISCVSSSLDDKLVRKDLVDENKDEVVAVLNNDDSYYRVGSYDKNFDTINITYDLDHFLSAIYSSSSSMTFKDFYYNRIGNEVIFRSYGQMPNTNNIFYNMYVGNKYIVSKDFDSYLYEEIASNTYKNEKVLPLGYVSNRLMSLDYYNSLSYPENIYAYMNYVIIDKDVDSNYDNVFDNIDLDYEIIASEVEMEEMDDGLFINSSGDSNVKIQINNDLKDKVLLISFDMNYQEKCKIGDTSIIINGVKNKLTCAGWKYNNQNYNFKYILSDKDLSSLDILFSKGRYLISNINFYIIDYDDIEKIVDDIDYFNVDMKKTSGDKIYGDIEVNESGYFNLSIPYDKGFNIYVDEEKVSYERVDVDFIGFEIDAGHHEIMIEYYSPFKNVGVMLSIIGLVLFLGGFYVNNNRIGRKFNKRNS